MFRFACGALLVVRALAAAKPKALIIGIDGTRPDALLFANAPNMKGLITKGAEYSMHGQVEISISAASWSNMFTGVTSETHGVVDNSFNGQFGAKTNYTARNASTLFQIIKANGGTAACYSAGNWTGIYQICKSALDDTDNLFFNAEHSFVAEAEACEEATAAVVAALDAEDYGVDAIPDLVVWYTHVVDLTGHESGFSIENARYIRMIEETDARVGRLLEAVADRERILGEDWLVLVTTDHGGSARVNMAESVQEEFDAMPASHAGVDQEHAEGVHGMNNPVHTENFLLLANGGSLRRRGGELFPPPTNVDVTPTILAQLGIPIPPGLVGSKRGGDLFGDDPKALVGAHLPANETYFDHWENA